MPITINEERLLDLLGSRVPIKHHSIGPRLM